MQLFNWLKRKRFTTETGHPLKQVLPLNAFDYEVHYLAVPLEDLTTWVLRYVEALETGETKKWCRCLWKIHPDDIDKPEGTRRMRRVDDDLECPIHTREGFLLNFFTWLEKQD